MVLTFNEATALNNMTDSEYLSLIESVDLNSLNEGALSSVQKYIKGIYAQTLEYFKTMANEFKLDWQEFLVVWQKAFKDPSFFGLLKSVNFSVKVLFRGVERFTSIGRDALLSIATDIHNNKVVEKIKSGVMSVDDFFKQHPILNKIKGVALAGFLLWGWLHMSFIGNAKYDFDWKSMIKSLNGSVSLLDAVASPGGTVFLSLLVIGMTTGISVAWFGLFGNVVFAILYTAYNIAPNIKPTAKMNAKLKAGRQRNKVKKLKAMYAP